jgi:predicted nuclease of predicted toxin-antitoxin system
VTLDNDFGELAVLHHHPHAGIIRVAEQSVWLHAALVQKVIDENEAALGHGAIVVVEADRTRVRVEPPDA